MLKPYISCLALAVFISATHVNAESISCVLENNKVLTVSNLSTSPVYSYGTAGNFELVLPRDASNGMVFKGQESFNAGGATFLAFTNNTYTYAIYSGEGRGWHFDGLRIYKGSDMIFEQQCKIREAVWFDLSDVNAPESDLPY